MKQSESLYESTINEFKDELKHKTDELNISNNKYNQLCKHVMAALEKILDMKDTYTQEHSKRVADYSKMIAIRMGKSDQEVEKIYSLGLLHDIGKLGIPTELLKKDTKLTKEEYEIVKSHVIIGAEILQEVAEITDAYKAALWHHERFDGTGYPCGLQGNEISEYARIIGIADAYDAMTSRRSYRDILPQAVVRKEIENNIGKQFDPIIAKIMLDIIDADENYSMREK